MTRPMGVFYITYSMSAMRAVMCLLDAPAMRRHLAG